MSGLKTFVTARTVLDGFGCTLVFLQVHGGCAVKRLFLGQKGLVVNKKCFPKKKPSQRFLFLQAGFCFSYPLHFPHMMIMGGNCGASENKIHRFPDFRLHGVYLFILQIDSMCD